jgi:succinate-semialdehyde dehydrogenase/glutarate-semialdehyde dehydrogenase
VTTETGKPISQSFGEVKKAAGHCRYYSENYEKLASSQRVKTEAHNSYVSLQPIGTVFIICPFNFPFWLPFKSGIPNIALGNSVILRTADSTPFTGLAVEELFREAGWDQNEFQNVFSEQSHTEEIIRNVNGVSFTGSSRAGKSIAEMAGRHLKKTVMELGGSDPFIVLEDADIDLAVSLAIKSRFANAG